MSRLSCWIVISLVVCIPYVSGRTIEIESLTQTVARYEKIEFIISVDGDYENPFDPDEVTLDIHIDSPKGRVSAGVFLSGI